MTEDLFCYHCRTNHRKDQMRRVFTKGGLRWRCVDSLQGARRSVAERDAFGRAQTEQNRADASRLAARVRHGMHHALMIDDGDQRVKPPSQEIGLLWL